MNINATIIIQAFNFFLVYWMLRFFLFRPVIAIIEHGHAEKQALLDIIDQQRKSLEIQEKEQKRHWYICQQYFTIHQPLQHIPLLSSEQHVTEPTIHPISNEELASIIFDIGKTLEEKIKHVH